MTDHTPPSDDLERIFLQYLQQLDRGDRAGLEQYLSSLNLPEEQSCQLRELVDAEEIVKQMAGPLMGDEIPSLPQHAVLNPYSEETVLVDDQTSEFPAVGAPQTGMALGGYEVLEELGRGGMGVVYKAYQVDMNREVALKMIRSGSLASDEDIQRFYFEARAAGKLRHPAIVQVYQVGEIDGHHYFTMEYIEGDDLAGHVRRKGLSPVQIAQLMVQVAEAVDFAHQRGLLHRDLKPSNILIDSNGNPRVTDFGLAKDMNSGEQLTGSGSAMGTPSYMPPEQARALRDEITCRSDVYSLGAILYALLVDRPPFRADSLVETLTQVIYEDPIPPREINPACPRGLEAICLKCLKKSPAERYQTAAEMAEDLQRFVRGERVRARRSYWYDRVWQWLRNVPMIAALLGRKSTSATTAHVRFQWGAIILSVLLLTGLVLIPRAVEWRRLSVIDVSTGQEGGSYQEIGRTLEETLRGTLGKPVRPKDSEGAVESHNRLLTGEADIAFLQANALSESEKLRVLAPLYQEVVLVILRREASLQAQSIEELKGLKIALGGEDSGMRLSARQLLSHHGLSENDLDPLYLDRSFLQLPTEPKLDGAIVTIKCDNPALQDILKTGNYRLLKLQDTRAIPKVFQVEPLAPGQLPEEVFPEGEVFWVPATYAILAVRDATPNGYVTEILDAIYQENGESILGTELISRQDAADMTYLDYHDAAHRFFSQTRIARPKQE